jgi:hypothetical protein
MYDRPFSASLVIACEGKEDPEIIKSPYGDMRSREGALLKYVKNDAAKVFERWSKDEKIPKEGIRSTNPIFSNRHPNPTFVLNKNKKAWQQTGIR